MWRFLIILAITASSCLSALAQEGKIEVRACGLQIVARGYGKDPKNWSDYLRPLRQGRGTRLALLVVLPANQILHLDPIASSVMLSDDKDTILGNKEAGVRANWEKTRFYSYPQISKDGKAAIIDIISPKLPGKGASKLFAMGTVILSVGKQKKAFETKDFEFKLDKKLKVDKLSLSVSKISKAGKKLNVEFQFKFDATWNPIQEISVTDADGKPIKARQYGYIRSSDSWRVTYQLDQQVDKANVTMSMWTDFYEEKIPFKIQTGLGLD